MSTPRVPVGAIFQFRDIPENAAARKELGQRDMRGLSGIIVGSDEGAALVRVGGLPFPKEVGVSAASWRVQMYRIDVVEQ